MIDQKFTLAVSLALESMPAGPKGLTKLIREYLPPGSAINDSRILREIGLRISSDANDGVRHALAKHLTYWDWQENAPWIASTPPVSQGRRNRIYDLLVLPEILRSEISSSIPYYRGQLPTLISAESKSSALTTASGTNWYTFEFRKQYGFYWKRVKANFEESGKFNADSLNSIDRSTDAVLSRLGDPAAGKPHCARGLVVGYVQSGKTTNFTAVISKAIDAGYRLIIVLSGTTNLLRNQTQRRLDMELVGVENILCGASDEESEHDYKHDVAWPKKFIKYGKQPSLLQSVDILRLTGQEDFQSNSAGINPVSFDIEKKNKQKPLYDRENLDHAGARLIVIKKQQDRLRRLIKDLKSVGASKCAEIPALIIDDESDQASVNTVNPEKASGSERSKINECIVNILERLPRAQYLGYTATPFANVFVDPSDPDDIYPRDFILSLERPKGYMGAREFHDMEPPEPGKLSNESAYVRSIPDDPESSDGSSARLTEAIDAFVLTAAIKKFREKQGCGAFLHHTMLVHQSSRNSEQIAAVEEIKALWKKAGYGALGPGVNRLRTLFDGDFHKVWDARGCVAQLPYPKSFQALTPYLGSALDQINSGSPVLMVNSAEGNEVPDFDRKEGVWKIIVGGAKLSRGYTVEGLTISYFSRSMNTQDALMQAGRWFGYREKYFDLVRLFISRAAGKKGDRDLYKSFENTCRDEESFREQLAQYEKDGLTPLQVPALVYNSYPKLRPTAKNKMFNAELMWLAFERLERTTFSMDDPGRKKNEKHFRDLFKVLDFKTVTANSVVPSKSKITSLVAMAKKDQVLSVLEKISWQKGLSPIQAELAYLKKENSPINKWIIIAPQLSGKGKGKNWIAGESFKCVERAMEDGHIKVFSTPGDSRLARWLVGDESVSFKSSDLKPSNNVGVLLFYPTRENEAQKATSDVPVMGFALFLPQVRPGERRMAYRVRDPKNPLAVTVSI
jgi:hypothetical protein